MNRLWGVCLGSLAALHGAACGQSPVAPKEADYTLLAYGNEKRQFLHLWLPESAQPAPLVVHYHGGGFLTGNIRKKTRGRVPARFNAAGIAYANVEYRLLPKTRLDVILRDCARSIQFLRHYAQKFNLDKHRVAAFGESAGAGASLWLATRDDLANPQSADLVLRESSRLTAAGGFQVQSTYDVMQWPGLLGLPPERTPYWNMLQSFERRLSAEKFLALRRDIDMTAHLDKGDPPLHFSPGSKGKGVHSHRFVEALQRRARETGTSLTIAEGNDRLIRFLTTRLNSPSTSKPSPAAPP